MNISIEASMLSAFFAAANAGWVEVVGEEPCAGLLMAEGESAWQAMEALLNAHAYQQTRDGLAMRAGRAAFTHFVASQGDALGLTKPRFRQMAVQNRLALGWQILAGLCDQAVAPTLQADVQAGYCLTAQAALSATQAAFLCGFFQEFLYWASQGRVYPLRRRDVNGFCFGIEALSL